MKFIPNQVTRVVSRQILIARKQSPHLLFAAGLVGIVGSTILSCRATLKLGNVLDKINEDVDSIKTFNLPEDQKKQLTLAYLEGTYNLTKLYAPALVVGVASVSALTGSHVVLTRRNTSLTAAYVAVSKAYEEYRNRVRDQLGEDAERDIYHAITHESIKDSSGKVVDSVAVADPNQWSPYARFFDEGSAYWKKNGEHNHLFVQCQQNYANHLLQVRGHVFLNEVYDMLGIDRSQAGQVVGWVIGPEGDNYIDFGIFKAANSAFVNGYERTILLDFNVDGVIYNKI